MPHVVVVGSKSSSSTPSQVASSAAGVPAEQLSASAPSTHVVAPVAEGDGDRGEPPTDYLNFLSGWDNTSLAVLLSILIVVALMIFSD